MPALAGVATTLFIGDRYSDFKASTENGCIFIWAEYGFGNVDEIRNLDFRIESIRDVIKVIEEIGG